jgi:hypothetical protein
MPPEGAEAPPATEPDGMCGGADLLPERTIMTAACPDDWT